MWIAIWVCFAAVVFAFVIWTLIVLFQQKKAWAAFAKRHKLKYEPGTLMGSPSVSGRYNDYVFSLYTGVQQTQDLRGQRFVTVIEFQLGSGMPTGGAVATSEFKTLIDNLIFNQSFVPDVSGWEPDYLARSRDLLNLKTWFTVERQEIMVKLFAIKRSSVLFFFDELEAVLRIETSDPLREEAHLEKIIKQFSNACDRLAPRDDERKIFKKLLQDEGQRGRVMDDDEDSDEDQSETKHEDIEDTAASETEDSSDESDEKPKPAKKKKGKAKSKKRSI